MSDFGSSVDEGGIGVIAGDARILSVGLLGVGEGVEFRLGVTFGPIKFGTDEPAPVHAVRRKRIE
jgi:hypothetical protein